MICTAPIKEYRSCNHKETPLQTISYLVYRKRTQKGLSKYALGKRSGVSIKVISRIENGQECNLSTALKIFEVLEIKII